MKPHKLTSLIIVFLFVSSIVNAQVEPAEAPMFGNVRSINPGNQTIIMNSDLVHDFGKISSSTQSFNFKLKNTGKTPMDVIDIKIPAKVMITIIDLHILPGQEGVFTATVDPDIMEKGLFSTWFIVTTQQNEPGELTTRETMFTITGEIK